VLPRDIKYRAIAREVLLNPNQSYADIARKTGIIVDSPRQSIYQYLHNDRFKVIMTEETPKYYDEQKLKRKLDEAIDATTPKESVHKGYLELGMRSLGLLVDKTINETHNYDESGIETMRQQAINGAIEAVKCLDGDDMVADKLSPG